MHDSQSLCTALMPVQWSKMTIRFFDTASCGR